MTKHVPVISVMKFFGDCEEHDDLIASNFLSNNKPFVTRSLFHHLCPKFHSRGAKYSFRN